MKNKAYISECGVRKRDSIQNNRIILDANGMFPKEIIFVDGISGYQRKYHLSKTKDGRFLLNK